MTETLTAERAGTAAARHTDGHLEGVGELDLYWQAWLPEGEPKAKLVVVHGGAEHGGRYGHLVDRLVPDGWAIYAMDNRGHGRSAGPRVYFDRFDNVIADLDQFVDLVTAEDPAGKPLMLGHSTGGCIALGYAIRHQDKLRALALSAPLAALETASPVQRVAVRTISWATPRVRIFKVDASTISRDPREVEAYDADPLVYRGGLPARTLRELSKVIEAFPETAAGLTLPLYIGHGTHDRLVPIRGSEMIADRAGSADMTFKAYDGYYHEMFNEPEADRARVLDDYAAWLNEKAA